ncbi:MAG: hypothetical protein A2138_07790 [Deltaproteobacteria bacterium RBG_16_71_12]|nr:MAG: hypothetical protein A2138_07790 [Deltaproteobacteria bacterium RBG_16_71_12]
MTEQVIHSLLLAAHNIALVGCAAAPFYNRQLVVKRGQYGPKLSYQLDKVVEDTLQGNAPFCIAFIATLWVTGIGMPLNHWVFHGELRHLHLVATVALVVKLTAVVGMMVIMFVIFSRLNPRLRTLFSGFSPDAAPNVDEEKEFFAKRARRKALCETCLKFAVVVLVASAFLGFGG